MRFIFADVYTDSFMIVLWSYGLIMISKVVHAIWVSLEMGCPYYFDGQLGTNNSCAWGVAGLNPSHNVVQLTTAGWMLRRFPNIMRYT